MRSHVLITSIFFCALLFKLSILPEAISKIVDGCRFLFETSVKEFFVNVGAFLKEGSEMV